MVIGDCCSGIMMDYGVLMMVEVVVVSVVDDFWLKNYGGKICYGGKFVTVTGKSCYL